MSVILDKSKSDRKRPYYSMSTAKNGKHPHIFKGLDGMHYQSIKNLPVGLNQVKNENERKMIMKIISTVYTFAKSSDKLESGIEECNNYYKVYIEKFRERFTRNHMNKVMDLNTQIGWLAIRDIYAEFDTKRIVVELNSENSRIFQPTLENTTIETSNKRLKRSHIGDPPNIHITNGKKSRSSNGVLKHVWSILKEDESDSADDILYDEESEEQIVVEEIVQEIEKEQELSSQESESVQRSASESKTPGLYDDDYYE